MDEIFRLSFGEHADLTCAMFHGDFSKTLAQAQRDKHEYILEGIGFKPGMRVLDIGSGFGPMLKAVQERSGQGIGLLDWSLMAVDQDSSDKHLPRWSGQSGSGAGTRLRRVRTGESIIVVITAGQHGSSTWGVRRRTKSSWFS